uniref:Uncharacterized protein n=1 Tax=Rhabditophanes sp. KR3021 TaxID=114890 RepID=A0AC35U2I1_9BILA
MRVYGVLVVLLVVLLIWMDGTEGKKKSGKKKKVTTTLAPSEEEGSEEGGGSVEEEVVESEEVEYEEPVCPYPWQTHTNNILTSFAKCSEYEESGIPCSPEDPIECTGRNPVCILSKNGTYRCCSDLSQDLTQPPSDKAQVKPICPYGGSSYDLPNVLLCEQEDKESCPSGYACEEAVNAQLTVAEHKYLCCKQTTLDDFANVFYETRVPINKYSGNLSMPVFYVTSLSPSIIPTAPSSGIDYCILNEYTPSQQPLPEIRTGDHFSMIPFKLREPVFLKQIVLLHDQFPGYFHHILVLYNPHGNPEAMNLYYNRPSTLSRIVDLTIPSWDEGAFFRSINRVVTISNDKPFSKQIRKLYIVLVFKTKKAITRRHPLTHKDLHGNYTSFTDFLTTETGKYLGDPVSGTYFWVTFLYHNPIYLYTFR